MAGNHDNTYIDASVSVCGFESDAMAGAKSEERKKKQKKKELV